MKLTGLVLGGDAHPVAAHGGGHRRDGLVLADDVALEPLLQLAEPLEFLLPDAWLAGILVHSSMTWARFSMVSWGSPCTSRALQLRLQLELLAFERRPCGS